MTVRTFLDSNVLIYAHDIDAGAKHGVAARVVAELWQSGEGVISTQVLQEFYVNVTRKIPSPLPRVTARQVVRAYSVWQTELVGPSEVLRASELEEEHRLSFWDALIVATALKGGAGRILTEDLSPGQSLSGLQIVNPFAASRG
jgi:predicted nucleic acid-binding protein